MTLNTTKLTFDLDCLCVFIVIKVLNTKLWLVFQLRTEG